jgi:divalent metal cation (Fe/Co/Zn/Cd) transporter
MEYLTVGWNLVEAIIALVAARISRSVATFGFGIDSVIECASASILIWRLHAEIGKRHSAMLMDELELRARKLVAGLLYLLVGYIVLDAVHSLWTANRPVFNLIGVVVLSSSIAVMVWLARVKKRLALKLGSSALQADVTQTSACWWLSVSALTGIGLNGLLGWWWADSAAAIVIAALVFREARAAWRGQACC